MSDDLPPDVSEIVAQTARWAAGYDSVLKWNEIAKLKADMMNVPERWTVVTVGDFRAACLSAGLSTEDTESIVELLKKRQAGRRLVPHSSYRAYRFKQEPGVALSDPPTAP